jgi:hypothetical protein
MGREVCMGTKGGIYEGWQGGFTVVHNPGCRRLVDSVGREVEDRVGMKVC